MKTLVEAGIAGTNHEPRAYHHDSLEEAQDAAAFPRDPQCPAPSPSVAEAIAQLKTAMRLDPGYAWAWHCNIAMPILDSRAGVTHEGANEAAANVMRHLFDVDVRNSREWMATFNTRQLHENGDGR